MTAVSSDFRSSPDLARPWVSSVRNPLDATGKIRAVLFDLDGTLYHQRPMRALMGLELAALAVSRPLQAPVSWRVLAEFRRAQEALRGREAIRGGAAEQVGLTARRTGVPTDRVEALVVEWMQERPLKYLPRCRADGVSFAAIRTCRAPASCPPSP